jgi:alpha-tubulin suppressor-like RCC1 family protein
MSPDRACARVALRVRAALCAVVFSIAIVLGGVASTSAAVAAEGGGEAASWGENVFLELGAGFKSTNEDGPVAVAGQQGITAVSAGDSLTLALTNEGTVSAWGGNMYGQLGNGTKTNMWEKQSGSHVQVERKIKATGEIEPLTGVTAVSASGNRALALLGSGTLVAWGNNELGQDGQGKVNPTIRFNEHGEKEETMAGTSPTRAETVEWEENGGMTKLEHVTAIAQGPSTHSDYAVVTNPTTGVTSVMAWGYNNVGQLGLGGKEEGPQTCNSDEFGPSRCSTKPVEVVGMPESVKQGKAHVTALAAGSEYALALLDNGTVLSWGNNGKGQLGTNAIPNNGSKARSNVPVTVEQFVEVKEGKTITTPLSKVVGIAAGSEHAVAVLENGTVVAWGGNANGKVGETSGEVCQSAPCDKVARPIAWEGGKQKLEGVSQVAAGVNYSVAVKNGEVFTFGGGRLGELGQSTGLPEECRNNKEIYEANGTVLNVFHNGKLCSEREECVSTTTPLIRWHGPWSEESEYGYGDGVEEAGVHYVSLKEGNKGHPATPGEWWATVTETKGARIKEEEGYACSAIPKPVARLGGRRVAAVAAGAKHVVALFEPGVAGLTPLVSVAPGSKSLTVSWETEPVKTEYKIKLGIFNPEKPESYAMGNAKTYVTEKEELKSSVWSEYKSNPLVAGQRYILSVRACQPECKQKTYPEVSRLIGGTPLP